VNLAVDTSAIIAILEDEPERRVFSEFILRHEPALSACSLIEALRVMQRRRPSAAKREVWSLVEAHGIEVVAFDRAQLEFAEQGLSRFGKGRRRPPAVLNFGDLFAYALARKLDVPLLFKGDDFRATDIRPALDG
jgi:ribonuclease VapC